jgi:CheY-like chemotaxis protein
VVCDALRAEGHRCFVIRSKAGAERFLRRVCPDLVVLDCLLVGGDGLQLAQQLALEAVGTNQPRSAKIMLTERGKLFEEKEPSLSDDEVSAAYENGKIAASLKGKPLATSPENIGFIAVKFALHDGSFATVLLDYFSARALATLIGSIDKIGWKTAQVLPDETRH